MDARLDALVAAVESNFNPLAVRFEPRLYVSRPMWMNSGVRRLGEIHRCSYNTAWAFGSTSWGQYQILGANIYGLGAYDDVIFRFVSSVDVQRSVFMRFVSYVMGEEYEHVEKKVLEDLDGLKDLDLREVDLGTRIPADSYLSKFVWKYNGAIYRSAAWEGYIRRFVRAFQAFANAEKKVERWPFGRGEVKVEVSRVKLDDLNRE